MTRITGYKTNQLCSFVINKSIAGRGLLDVSVDDGLIQEMKFNQVNVNQFGVSFFPIENSSYLITVQFNKEIVPG